MRLAFCSQRAALCGKPAEGRGGARSNHTADGAHTLPPSPSLCSLRDFFFFFLVVRVRGTVSPAPPPSHPCEHLSSGGRAVSALSCCQPYPAFWLSESGPFGRLECTGSCSWTIRAWHGTPLLGSRGRPRRRLIAGGSGGGATVLIGQRRYCFSSRAARAGYGRIEREQV